MPYLFRCPGCHVEDHSRDYKGIAGNDRQCGNCGYDGCWACIPDDEPLCEECRARDENDKAVGRI